MKKLSFIFLLVVGVLALVLCARVYHFTPRRAQIKMAAPAPIDLDAALKRLAQAVQQPTVSASDPGDTTDRFRRFHDFLAHAYPAIHAKLTREIINGSLLYTWKGTDESLKPILFAAHMDVVPVDPKSEADWKYPPFSGTVADGYLWGRGTMDDKGSLMAILEALEHLLSQGFQPFRTIYLAFGHDEEIGGQEGARKIADLLASRHIELDFVLDEGSSVLDDVLPGIDAPTALIGIAEKGYLSLDLNVETAGGHASIPPAQTAIGTLSQALTALNRTPFPSRLPEPTKLMLEFLGPDMPWLKRLLFANLWLFDPLVRYKLAREPLTNAAIRTTLAPTVIEGGIRENVLPSKAHAIVNLRLLPGDTSERAIEQVRKTIADSAVQISARQTRAEPSPVSETNSLSFRLLQRTIREIIPDAVVAPALLVAATDSRHYAPLTQQVYRFLPITLGRSDLQRYHGIDERIGAQDYARAIRFYIQLIRNGQEWKN